jgi:hypothetical protein
MLRCGCLGVRIDLAVALEVPDSQGAFDALIIAQITKNGKLSLLTILL